MSPNRLLNTGAGAILAAALMLLALGAEARAATDKRELQAREDFAAGRYQEAVEIFAKLYAEKLHPNYLRNIGRCYQNLGQPEKAISAFREYLRKAKTVSADERAEVEGYIKEMEDLEARQQAPVATPPPSASPPAPPLPSAAPLPAAAPESSATLATTPGPAAANEAPPIYARWWFWGIVGGVVLAGVAGLGAAGAFTSHKDAACVDPGRICK
ncbi:MAG TPA: tetratricopeptide repeat protein [Polyangia bacterium]|nr:tetratricopeptide repeat protein [Polyangia bacterium]